MDLLAKITRAGMPLVEYAGAKPYRGVLTGFNEAFVIDVATRDRFIKANSATAEFIKPYLRGQDLLRWNAPETGLHIILLKSSSDFAWPWKDSTDDAAERIFADTYPAIHAHMKRFESLPGDKPDERKGLRHREDHGRYWWELRSCAYYAEFEKTKLVYPDITWTTSFAIDNSLLHFNNTIYFLPTSDPWIAAVLNAPIGWWRSWRGAQHAKDDALRYFSTFVENYPIPPKPDEDLPVTRISDLRNQVRLAVGAIHDWLRVEFDMNKFGRRLEAPELLDPDGFAAAVRAALPRRRRLSAAEVARLKREHAASIAPAQRAAAEMQALERRLFDLVNQAYGLTPEEEALMWATAPPRMPLAPQGSPGGEQG